MTISSACHACDGDGDRGDVDGDHGTGDGDHETCDELQKQEPQQQHPRLAVFPCQVRGLYPQLALFPYQVHGLYLL